MLVLQASRDPALIVPVLERPDAEGAPGVAGRIAHSGLVRWQRSVRGTAELLEPAGRYAISDAAWAMHLLGLQQALPQSSYTSMTETLPMLRAIKDEDEVSRLASAGAAADATFEDIVGVPFAGRSERDIGEDLAGLLSDHGHSQVDFTVVGSGPNGANPHHEVSEHLIRDGDMVVLDFGGLKDGYGSDTTRTVHVGEPTDEERAIHEIVRNAQRLPSGGTRSVSCRNRSRRCKVISDAVTATSSSIGQATESASPRTSRRTWSRETRELDPGMCFSIEPGIYLPGRFSVRIEDIVTVTERGPAP
jgi:Xaa-Pro aminopeptidase